MRVALLGLGLIGGSIARAVAAGRAGRAASGAPSTGASPTAAPSPADAADIELTAWTPSGSGPRAALSSGIVSRAPERAEEAIAGADLVVLAAPPLECLGLLGSLAGEWRSALGTEATVTDVASTKGAIVARAAQLGLPFVGGHPMAGRESSGFAASDAALFSGRPWIVVAEADGAGHDQRRVGRDVARVERLARACGARPLRLSAEEHDAATAAISHLPLVLSAALVEAVAADAHSGWAGPAAAGWPLERELAAGGWDGMTRLARGEASMGAGILVTNAGPVAERIRRLRSVLDDWLDALEDPAGPDPIALTARLRAAAERLRASPDDPEERADGR